MSPGGYTLVVVLGISHALQVSGEPVNLTSAAPSGITVEFTPKSPVELSASGATNVTLSITASSAAPVGNDTIMVNGTSGSNTQSSSFTLRVVQYRVVAVRNSFLPGVLNISQGSTVFWQNLDGPAAGCAAGGGGSGSGQHSIVFTTLQGANSPTLNQFKIYQYTFNTPGSYFYYSGVDTDHSMNGTINVMATGGGAGGMGMAPRIPTFSSVEGGYAALSPVAMKQASWTTHATKESVSPAFVLTIVLSGLTVLALGYIAFYGRLFDFGLRTARVGEFLLATVKRAWKRTTTDRLLALEEHGVADGVGARHPRVAVRNHRFTTRMGRPPRIV